MPDTDWYDKAEQNTDKWGVQRPESLVFAIAEELAEIADEIMANAEPSSERLDRNERELLRLYIEIIELGYAIRDVSERTYEDSQGSPIPQKQRPRLFGKVKDEEAVMEEVDDIGPLAIQLAESVEEYGEW